MQPDNSAIGLGIGKWGPRVGLSNCKQSAVVRTAIQPALQQAQRRDGDEGESNDEGHRQDEGHNDGGNPTTTTLHHEGDEDDVEGDDRDDDNEGVVYLEYIVVLLT